MRRRIVTLQRGAPAAALVAALALSTGAFSARAETSHPPSRPTHPGKEVVSGPATGHAPPEQAAHGTEDDENEGPPPMNWWQFGTETPPFLATLINFVVFAGGFYVFGRKPLGAALRNRRDTIAKDIDDARAIKDEAEARAKTYQSKLETLEVEAGLARQALLQAGEAERERIVKDAEAKAERMRKESAFLVAQELKQIRQDLMRSTVDAAVAAAAALLVQRITLQDQERLADDYLADLAKRTPAAPMPAEPGTAS